jgi:hypothetical protein
MAGACKHGNKNLIYIKRAEILQQMRCLFVCLFVFLVLQPIMVVFSKPGNGL